MWTNSARVRGENLMPKAPDPDFLGCMGIAELEKAKPPNLATSKRRPPAHVPHPTKTPPAFCARGLLPSVTLHVIDRLRAPQGRAQQSEATSEVTAARLVRGWSCLRAVSVGLPAARHGFASQIGRAIP